MLASRCKRNLLSLVTNLRSRTSLDDSEMYSNGPKIIYPVFVRIKGNWWSSWTQSENLFGFEEILKSSLRVSQRDGESDSEIDLIDKKT